MRGDGIGGLDGRRRLRLLSVAAPLAGLALLYPARALLLRAWPAPLADLCVGLVAAAGILAFSWAVFRMIARQDRHLARQHAELARRYKTEHRLRAQLEALHQASLAIASEHTPGHILQRLVDLARALIGARYAELGVLGPHGAVDAVYSAGVPGGGAWDPRLAGPPDGDGDPRGRGLLDVPVAHGGRVVGALHLAGKEGGGAFGAEDERLLALLAGHAAVVIDNARLAEQVRALAIVAERDRIGKDLHDGAIQSIYAVSLGLEDAAEDVEADPAGARARIDAAIDGLGAVMADIRRFIGGLQAGPGAGKSLAEELTVIVAEARVHTLIEPHLRVAGGADLLPPAVAREVAHIAREAVANVVRHARASHLWVTLEVEGDAVSLRVADDGVGFDPGRPVSAEHRGLRNMRERAAALGGTLAVEATPDGGTTIDVRAPLGSPGEAGEAGEVIGVAEEGAHVPA